MINRGVLRSSIFIVAIFIGLNLLAMNLFGTPLSAIGMTGKVIENHDAILSVSIEKHNKITIFLLLL